MLEIFYNYESWIGDDGAIFDVVVTSAMICSVIVFIACLSLKSRNDK